MKKTHFIITSATFFLMLSSQAMAVKEELSYQALYPQTHDIETKVFAPAFDALEKATNGEIVVNVFPMGSIVVTAEIRSAVQRGTIDMGGAAFTLEPNEFPYFQATCMPGLTKEGTHCTALAYSLYENDPIVKKELDKAGKLLGMWGNAPMGFFSVNTPIYSPEDLKGKRVLVTTPGQSDFIKALGGTPIFTAPTDIYVGLQRGMGEVLCTGWTHANSIKIQEVTKYATIISAECAVMPLIMNRDLYESFTDSQKKAIDDIFNYEFSLKSHEVLLDDMHRNVQRFEESGVKIVHLTPEQQTVFATKMDNYISNEFTEKLTAIGVKNPVTHIEKVQKLAEDTPIPAIIGY